MIENKEPQDDLSEESPDEEYYSEDLDIYSKENGNLIEDEEKKPKPVKRTLMITLGVFIFMGAMAFTGLSKTPETIHYLAELRKSEAVVTEVIFNEEDTNFCDIVLNDGEDELPIKGEADECKVKVGDKIKF